MYSTVVLFISGRYSVVCIDYIVLTHSVVGMRIVPTCCSELLCGRMFSVLLGIYLGVDWLDHVVTLFSLWRDCQSVFQRGRPVLYSYRLCMRISTVPNPQ